MTQAWDKEKSVDSGQFLSQEEEIRGEDRRREDRTGKRGERSGARLLYNYDLCL